MDKPTSVATRILALSGEIAGLIEEQDRKGGQRGDPCHQTRAVLLALGRSRGKRTSKLCVDDGTVFSKRESPIDS
jgi:hypothetical protein